MEDILGNAAFIVEIMVKRNINVTLNGVGLKSVSTSTAYSN